MPRTISRKRNNRRNESTARVTSNLSPDAPEFIPIANDETTANLREHIVIQSMTFCGSSTASNSSGNNSSSNYESTSTISSIPDTLKNKGQRDLLINLLNESKVDCVICYERAKNVEQIWNCRNCFQIMHLKCIIVWFIKSHCNAVWRCPACQSEVTGKPKYVCFCGALPNPYHNNVVDTPHSCGQVCGLQRKNLNLNYNDCHHKCTLLCHPGPCPQCVVQVLRSCGCGKKQVYAQCGQSTQIVCNNVCLKKLNCQIHECEKICHENDCEPCNKGCLQNLNPSEETLVLSNARFSDAILQYNLLPPESVVTEEELRMLGLNPEELFEQRNINDSYYSDSSNYDVANNMPYNNIIIDEIDASEVDDDDFEVDIDDVDDDGDVDDIDDIIHDFNIGYHYSFPRHIFTNPLTSDTVSRDFEMDYPVTDDGEDDTGGEELEEWTEPNESDDNHVLAVSSSDEGSENDNTSSLIESDQSDQSDRSWDTSLNDTGDDEVHVGILSSYSDDSSDSSQSGISYLNGSVSTSCSSSSSSSSCSSSSSSL